MADQGENRICRSVAEACRALKLRMTGPRKVIVGILDGATDHPDALELHRRATAIDPTISLATIYRTLRLLEEHRILDRHAFGDGPARYETTAQSHHDHLIDIESGRVIEFHSEEIERLQEEIARRHGYAIVRHRLEIYVRPLARRTRKQSRA